MLVTSKYVFFQGKMDFLSNFYPSPFEYKGEQFPTVEHFFQYCKAITFGDLNIAKQILETSSPYAAKILGRKVTPYDDELWLRKGKSVMEVGLRLKYAIPELRSMFVSHDYRDKEFVECSKKDCLWAIGLTIDNELINDDMCWLGLNWLGRLHTKLFKEFEKELPRFKEFPYTIDNYLVRIGDRVALSKVYVTESWRYASDNCHAMIMMPTFYPERHEDWYALPQYANKHAVMVLPEDWKVATEIERSDYKTKDGKEVSLDPIYSWK